MARPILNPRTGRVVYVDRNGRPLTNYNPGVVSEARAMDLLSRLPDADLAGATGYGVVPGGGQNRGARRAELEQHPAPMATYRPLAGARPNNRGNSILVEIPSLPIGTTSQTTSTIVETPRDNGADAEMITVTLGIQQQNADVAVDPVDNIIRVTAIITWGTGGAIFSAEIDWLNGSVFSIPASYISIKARVDTFQGATPPPNLVLSASLGYGNVSAHRSSKTRLTTPFSLSGAAGVNPSTGFILLPPFVTSFGIVATNTPPSLSILLVGAKPPVVPLAAYGYTDNTNGALSIESTFAIPAGTAWINVTNLAVGSSTGAIIWNVGI
jgi:hypothetical protein